MKQITENVFIEDQYSVPPNYRGCNSGFVTTSEGIVMIDTPMMPTDAIKLRHTITKKGKIKYIINTDYHIDHVTGNFFFPGTVISHELVKELISDRGILELIREYDQEGLS